ncbi:MAG TPA: hypothetical protein VFG31_08825 [Conexibacter sp.]|nr:hypothetical protein [Conexibacter sp.]
MTMTLTLVCLGAIFGIWVATTDLRRWRVVRVAQLRELWRRLRRVRA